MTQSVFPWLEESWQQLQQLRARLPHAILFYGPEGIGKTAFVESFAQSLLCESVQADGHACGACASCGWFSQYNHPDYRRVRPEVLDGEDAIDTGDGSESSEDKKSAKASKTPSKEIKIDQIRALSDFMNVSTHRSGMRVVVLYPAEALNTAAANSLLKTLEEPPPQTMFLLVSNRLDRLLPTILSRCRKFALALPSHQAGLAWLQQQNIKDADVWLSEQGGAPLAALHAASGDGREVMDEFLRCLGQPSIDVALKTAERLQKTAVADLVGWLQRWLYDLLAMKSGAAPRYYPRYARELNALLPRLDTVALAGALKAANERRAIADHPLSARLFIEEMLLEYQQLFT
ncbi:DNA polymerase-3 subunit delta' [Herbaspirillum sp. Sphag1AN]|uniref:DNA polymerase III subunit delta' n=1 Tax=unclassified Herbaspirillum TaxID=2624150 RepID=UPI00160BE0B9|nr:MULTISPECIES: DNA polymerase III subunit delta' [unclassified Herbaspirillum]MBB3211997.1 DNA polymerase-3 subunit delta' [Herbaspirillum sp. Sphag1AN]MBB3244169.1 DNA polymerase-3 subunit delta' [Herbaspirillum sp. Sphag64]